MTRQAHQPYAVLPSQHRRAQSVRANGLVSLQGQAETGPRRDSQLCTRCSSASKTSSESSRRSASSASMVRLMRALAPFPHNCQTRGTSSASTRSQLRVSHSAQVQGGEFRSRCHPVSAGPASVACRMCLREHADGVPVTRKVAVCVVHGARAFAQHVETEAQMRLAATLRAGLAEGVFNGLPSIELPRASSCTARSSGGDHRFERRAWRTGRAADGVWRSSTAQHWNLTVGSMR